MSKPGPRSGADESGGGQPTQQDPASLTRTSGLNEALRLADLTSLEDDEGEGAVVRDQPTRVVSSISGSVPVLGRVGAARLSALDAVASLEDEAEVEHRDAPTRVISVHHASAVADDLRRGRAARGDEAATPAAPLTAAPGLGAALDALDSLEETDGERLDEPTRVVLAHELEKRVSEVPSDVALLDSIFDTLEVADDDEAHGGVAGDESLESLEDADDEDADDGDDDVAGDVAASARGEGRGEGGSGRWLGFALLALGLGVGVAALTMDASGPLVAVCGAGAALLIAGAVMVLRGRG